MFMCIINSKNVNEQYKNEYTDLARLLREKLPPNKVITVAVAAKSKRFERWLAWFIRLQSSLAVL